MAWMIVLTTSSVVALCIGATVEVALKRYEDERARLDEAERRMAKHTQDLSRVRHVLEQHISQWSAAQGAGNDLAGRIAGMVDAVTKVVIAVQAERTAARNSVESDEAAASPRIEIVDKIAALVDAMTDVVGVVRTRPLPAIEPPADGATKAAGAAAPHRPPEPLAHESRRGAAA